MFKQLYVRRIVAVYVLLQSSFLVGCDSAGVSVAIPQTQEVTTVAQQTPVRSQAIDGYIVGGKVFCDSAENGQTGAGGWLQCPAGTGLISVVGGRDVGFDPLAVDGGSVFIGTLKGPGDAPFITPLTSVASELSVSNGQFDRSRYDQAVQQLGEKLGMAGLDLSQNPAADLALAKANTQINLLVSQFATTTDDYSHTLKALSEMFITSNAIDLTDSVANLSAINETLLTTAPHLVLEPAAYSQVTNEVADVLVEIDSSSSIAQVAEATEHTIVAPTAFSIDRNQNLFNFRASGGCYQTWGYYNYRCDSESRDYSLADFENAENSDGSYQTRISRVYWNRHITFKSNAFIIDRSLHNASIDVAVDVQSLLDSRQLSVIVKGVQLSMERNDSRSINLTVPAGTLLDARYVEQNGVATDVEMTADENLLASSVNGSFVVSLDRIESHLRDLGYASFFRQYGHYRMTVVFQGVQFDLSSEGVRSTPDSYTVQTATDSISGLGLQGFVSITR